MKTNIAFDLDDVMVNFAGPVEEILKTWGYEIDPEIHCFDYEKRVTPEIQKEELLEIFEIIYNDPWSIPIVDKAPELCSRIFLKTGEPVSFITSRQPEYATQTYQLIKRFCRVPYTVAFADRQYGKGLYLNGISYFVDDRKKTAMELAEDGKTVLVPRRNWNQDFPEDFEHLDSIVYIDDISEVLDKLNIFLN